MSVATRVCTAPEWKALLRLLPPEPEARPILRKAADGARFFEYARLTNDYIGARLLVASCAAHRDVGGACVFNVGQRAALTFVIYAHPNVFTRAQKNIVSAVLLKAEEICGPVNAMLCQLPLTKVRGLATSLG